MEVRQLVRGRAVLAGLAVLLVAGLAGIAHGRSVIDRQRATLVASPAVQKAHQRAILQHQPPSAIAGDQLYYLTFHTAHEPSPLAPISIGQRDVQAYNLKVRMLALHGQLYDADLGNPLLAAFGNFDLAFVLVFVVPLFVIALTYDVWSGEQDAGTWDLVRAQPVSPLGVLGVKLAVRIAFVAAAVLVLLVLAAILQDLPVDGAFLLVAGVSMAYVLFWSGLSLLVASFRRPSELNLLALLALWISFAVLGPALVNVVAATRFPLGEVLELTIRQRQGYHASWDRPLDETMARFYERYPEWAAVPVPRDTYSNAWYYAMQQRGDEEAAPAVEAYFSTIDARQQWMTRAAALLPPAAFQAALNAVARTDLESHLAYLRSVADYHERLKRHFFPVIFHNHRMSDVDWTLAPRHRFQAPAPESVRWFTGATVTAAVILVIAGCAALRRSLSGEAGVRPAQSAPTVVTSTSPGYARASRARSAHPRRR